MYGSTHGDDSEAAAVPLLLSASFGESESAPRGRKIARVGALALIGVTMTAAVVATTPSGSKGIVRAGLALQDWANPGASDAASLAATCEDECPCGVEYSGMAYRCAICLLAELFGCAGSQINADDAV